MDDPAVPWLARGEHHQAFPGTGARIELVGVAQFRRDEQGLAHRHACWEILLPLGGRMDLLTRAGDRRLATGRLAVVPPGLAHTVRAVGGPLRLAYLGLGLDAEPAAPPTVLEADAATAADLGGALATATAAVEAGEATDDVRLLGCALRLCDLLGIGPHPPARSPAQRLVAAVRRHLLLHFNTTVSVAAIAADLYLSPGHLGEVFRRETGQTIKACHRALRLQEGAARLLREDATPGSVAAELGYPTVQAFSRDFRAHFGVPPGRFQDMHRRGVRS